MINLFAYSDRVKTNNPQLRDFDYARQIVDVPTSKTRSQQHVISPKETESILSLQRTITGGASWTISNPEGVTSRFTWSVTNPVLRTQRVGGTLANADTISAARLATSKIIRLTFSNPLAVSIVAGDEIFIGPGSGLSALNQGIFTIVASTSLTVDLLSEEMVTEPSVIITDINDIYAYSVGPVRVGDSLRISSTSFNFGNRGEFQITKVTSKFLEVQNSDLVPEGPIAANIMIYDHVYKMFYLETDQKINIYLNSSADAITVEPFQDGGLVGVYLLRGPVVTVDIENVGVEEANITSFFAM